VQQGGDDVLVDTHTPPRFSTIHPDLDVGHRPRVGAAGLCVLVTIEHLEANPGFARERIDERGDGAVTGALQQTLAPIHARRRFERDHVGVDVGGDERMMHEGERTVRGRRLPDVKHRFADLDGEVGLGAGEPLGRILGLRLDVRQRTRRQSSGSRR